MQTHAWDDGTPLEETLSTLTDLVRQGKVRYLGLSNVSGWQLQKIIDLIKYKGYEPFVSLQVCMQLSYLNASGYSVYTLCVHRTNMVGAIQPDVPRNRMGASRSV